MSKNTEKLDDLEKAFNIYIKIILTRTARDFYRAQSRYYANSIPLELAEENDLSETNFEMNIGASEAHCLEKYIEDEILALIIGSLQPKEKYLIYLKFFEDKTDRQIAMIYGIRQQSLNQRKNRLLNKLRKTSKRINYKNDSWSTFLKS